MPAAPRIGIIGTGGVGSSLAMAILRAGYAGELLLDDARPGLAEGEAMDLAHGAAFYPPAHVRAAPVDEMVRIADAVVLCAGRAGTASETRLDLLRANASFVRALARRFSDYEGLVVMVTNPVDVLTQVFRAASGLPASRVVGTGTLLDTARLRQRLGRELGIHPRSVHAQVVGEHGDSEVVLWSSAAAGGIALRDWPQWHRSREAEIAGEVRTAAYEVIRRKGATNHAIALATASLLGWMLRDEGRVVTVSRVQPAAGIFGGVAFSLPCIVGADGAHSVVRPDMDADEERHLLRSAALLAEAAASTEEPAAAANASRAASA